MNLIRILSGERTVVILFNFFFTRRDKKMNYEPLVFVLTICFIGLCVTMFLGHKSAFLVILMTGVVYTLVWVLCALLVVFFA